MALTKCPECGKEISDSAKMCPHCGYKTQFGQAESKAKSLLIGNILHISAMIVGIILSFTSVITLSRIDDNFEDWLADDPDNIFVIIRFAIGIGLFVAGFIHYLKVSRKTFELRDELIPTKEDTVSPVEEINTFVKMEAIPESKQCYGVFGKCEMCDTRGATAMCRIPDFPDEYELCVDCINQYMAQIN